MHFGSDFVRTMVLFEFARNMFSLPNLFSMNRYEAVVLSTVTAAALLGIRHFVKQYSAIISWIIIAMAVSLAEYRMNILGVLKGVFTMSKYEISLLAGAGVLAFFGGRHLISNVRKQWLARKLKAMEFWNYSPEDDELLWRSLGSVFESRRKSWFTLSWYTKYIGHVISRKKFENTPKDVVILHGFSRPRTIPNISPFVFKVETFLRMAQLKYEYDETEPYGPEGKAPWISVNGEHITDSEFIIDFLLKKFEIDVNNRYSREQLAVATCVKLVLEEHCIWGLSLERFVFNKEVLIDQSMHMPFLVRLYMQHAIKNRSEAQGMGTHTQEEIEKLVKVDLRAVSTILGDNQFICGDRPCVYDSGIFAVLSQIVWGKPDSRYKKLLEEECRNLEDYCVRMKEKYFSDWEDLLAK